MAELLYEVFQPVNLVPTLLLLLVLVYWLLVIVGVLSDEMFSWDLDGAESASPWLGAFKFLHASDAPAMVIASIFILFFWLTTVLSNHYFNPEFSFWLVLLFLIPNVIASVLLTKAILFPAIALFKRLSPPQSHDKAVFVGRLAMVHTSEITDEFGQIAIQQDGPPMVFNARCFGTRPRKGDIVEIVEYQPVTDTFLVRLSKRMG